LGAQRLPKECAAWCDNLLTIPGTKFEQWPLGVVGPDKIIELDRALRFALENAHEALSSADRFE
jgi:hypothetical protein